MTMEPRNMTVKELKESLSMLDESFDNKIIKVVIPQNIPEGDYRLAYMALPNMVDVLFFPQELVK